MAIGDHGVEGAFDPVAIELVDDERRQQLDRMIGVTRDLNEDVVLLEQAGS